MDVVWLVSLIVACLAGVGLSVFRLPGTWLVLAAATACSWHFDWDRPGWKILVTLLTLALAGEGLETLSSVVTARRAGASRRTMWCALAGGIAGMFVFTVPLPIIGTILGGALGCFLGALVGEMSVQDDLRHGARVGFFAALGQVLGTVAKMMICVVMAGTTVCAVFSGRG